MPKSLNKVQKHITKKKGKAAALHSRSRDSKMLLRAGAREARVEKMSSLREKANLTYLQRVKFVQGSIMDGLDPIDKAQVRKLILRYIERDSEELEELQRKRRHGRSPGTRELLLQQQREAAEREFEAGYWIPDVTDAETLASIKKWNGQWVALNTMRFVRVTKDGEWKDSSFPPKGNS